MENVNVETKVAGVSQHLGTLPGPSALHSFVRAFRPWMVHVLVPKHSEEHPLGQKRLDELAESLAGLLSASPRTSIVPGLLRSRIKTLRP